MATEGLRGVGGQKNGARPTSRRSAEPTREDLVMIERTRAQGVVVGYGDGTLRLEYAPGTADVKVGDPVEGGRVAAIHEDHIVLSDKGGRRAVYLLDQAIRTQPQAQARPARKNRN